MVLGITDFKVHWKAPLQPKGFLKIVEFFLAIIAFSLVAGFSVETTFNIACNPSQLGDTFNYTVKSSYSFGYINGIEESFRNGTLYRSKLEASVGRGVQQNAQFFVTWGVFTMFYCIIALLVYMLVTANEQWEKAFDFLVFTDIAFHILWILMWFIASVSWAVAFNRLDDRIGTYYNALKSDDCNGTANVLEADRDNIIYAQAQIAVVFGFVIQFLWACNIGWLVIDTSWYINWRASRGQ